jgi:hypothetical protein
MRFKCDSKFCIWGQVSAYRFAQKVSPAETAQAVLCLEHKGFQLKDLEIVIGRDSVNWEQNDQRIVVGLAYGLRRRHFTRRQFETYARDVRRAAKLCPGPWEPDVSPEDILKLERPRSFDHGANEDE